MRPLYTRNELEALGYCVQSTYDGPLSLEDAAALLTGLAIARNDSGRPIFSNLLIIAQGDGCYNVVYLMPPLPVPQDLRADPYIRYEATITDQAIAPPLEAFDPWTDYVLARNRVEAEAAIRTRNEIQRPGSEILSITIKAIKPKEIDR